MIGSVLLAHGVSGPVAAPIPPVAFAVMAVIVGILVGLVTIATWHDDYDDWSLM